MRSAGSIATSGFELHSQLNFNTFSAPPSASSVSLGYCLYQWPHMATYLNNYDLHESAQYLKQSCYIINIKKNCY